MATNSNVLSGNKITLQLDGKDVGVIQSARCSDDYSPEPATCIGSIAVTEWVPTLAKHTIAISHMTLSNKALRTQGLNYENGEAMLKGTIFDILFSEKGGTLSRKYTGCSYASGDVDVQANKIVVSNATFNALNVVGTAF